MESILDPSSYELNALSAPFALAVLVVVVTAAYVLLMEGAPVLRGSWLIICVGLLPFVSAVTLIGSTVDPVAAEALFKIAISLLPLTSTGVLMFMLALARRLRHHIKLVGVFLAISLAIVVPTLTTDWIVDGVWKTPTGLYWMHVGTYAPIQAAAIGAPLALGIAYLWRRLHIERSALRRRQFKASMLAFGICGVGLADTALGYGYGYFPISWLGLTVGTTLALRSIIIDDLIRAGALDRRAPLALLYLVIAALGVWLTRWSLGADASVALVALLLIGLFLALRVATIVVQAFGNQRKTMEDTPLERVLDQYASRVQRLRTEPEIAALTTEMAQLGLGTQSLSFLLPSDTDYSWERDGEQLDESLIPDPMLLGWLIEHGRPVQRDNLDGLRLGSMRESLERLLDAHEAELLVPLRNRDEMVGMLLAGSTKSGRSLRRDEAQFVGRLVDHASSALVYARMHREATHRVEVDKEVELAAAVQSAFVPKGDVVKLGRVTLSGAYSPATQCGGDWWSVHDLPDGRVLVLIGDVTGHGVAAAMVTAAAKGCYDVAQRLMGADIDLVRLLELLDASVRKVGANRFHMTCFATLIDSATNTVTFANAGHVVPYVLRKSTSGEAELHVLVARGNPLGAGDHTPNYRSDTRPIEDGDMLVWYTDGIVECVNHERKQFGDRRMQRLLRKADLDKLDARSLRDQMMRAAIAFQDGVPPDDDITLVVAKVA
jgi:serine phosphatase RsbU (regulator of sigma subunit)